MGLFEKIKNALQPTETKKEAKRLKNKTSKNQLYRFNQEIANWKVGVEMFEDQHNPSTVEIIRVYNDVVLDAHLSAAMDARISRTTSKNNKIIDDKGEEIIDQTALLSGPWFRDFLRYSLESKFFGYSLIQFGDQIGQSFDEVEVVPREYVFQQKKAVRTHPNNSFDTIPFDSGEFLPWVVGVGRSNDIGLLCKASPLVIFKKATIGAWTESAELFGAPFRMGKTNINEETLRDNMFDMLDKMGRNAYGVFDKDDTVEFITTNKTDAYQIYDKLIERTNSELSKLILGSTMLLDDGSSRSQSEVHEKTTAAITKEDALFLSDVVNKQLIPFLRTYHGFKITGKWVWDDSENTTKKEQFDIDIELIREGYDVPLEYITETYGTPVNGKKEAGAKDVQNVIKKKSLLAKTYETFMLAHSCEICNAIDEGPEPEWSEDYIDSIILGVYTGKYSVGNLPESLYRQIALELNKGLFAGLSTELDSIPNTAFINALRNNAFVFSGAKTFQQIRLMSDYLTDERGNVRSFKEFKDFAKQTFNEFNVNWLRTERNQATGSAQMAEKWRQIEEEIDLFPFLKYVTVGDARVRESHQVLDGVIKPVGDKFWSEYMPKNGWNCRCTVQQLDQAKVTDDKDIIYPDVPDYMKFNSGQKKILFSPKHPYFVVEKQFEELKNDNFGLPYPEPLN